MADALVEGGFAQAGYTQVSIDDCWSNGRDPNTRRLRADPDRFPHGIPYLVQYMEQRNLTLGIYADSGRKTCANFEGTYGYEELDAETFIQWGVSYVKMDACNMPDPTFRTRMYTRFGDALQQAQRKTGIGLIYSCSWAVYFGKNESTRPLTGLYHEAGCNTWRNFHDIGNSWKSLYSIIMHWADYWSDLQKKPSGTFNDADMLLVGDMSNDHGGLSVEQARLQFGFWAMIASPLFIGADVRSMSPVYRDILLNQRVIAINQDVSGRQADCVLGCSGAPAESNTGKMAASTNLQVWFKSVTTTTTTSNKASMAIAFFNLNNGSTPNNQSATLNITYQFSARRSQIGECFDLWSASTVDLCNQGRGGSSEYWEIRVVRVDDDTDFDGNTKDDPMVHVSVAALNMPPTCHRLLRIDSHSDDQIQPLLFS
ncbi:Alpha-galactosidase A [Seminavis robusta]|uniref:Alpha-galactosidase n=1 Tax=Seminavis robusta TaxID=568900 RepID=A0A9N8E4V3_9STRA|nr:Alpha-galactosidase A [Seminavis robusta]|eukprot:Sro503_g155810.1 Alpha-galactosidase A (427) ;mRNA; f:28148-29428